MLKWHDVLLKRCTDEGRGGIGDESLDIDVVEFSSMERQSGTHRPDVLSDTCCFPGLGLSLLKLDLNPDNDFSWQYSLLIFLQSCTAFSHNLFQRPINKS